MSEVILIGYLAVGKNDNLQRQTVDSESFHYDSEISPGFYRGGDVEAGKTVFRRFVFHNVCDSGGKNMCQHQPPVAHPVYTCQRKREFVKYHFFFYLL